MPPGPRHYTCGNCDHRWSISAEDAFRLMRMMPVCPECGATDVYETFAGKSDETR